MKPLHIEFVPAHVIRFLRGMKTLIGKFAKKLLSISPLLGRTKLHIATSPLDHPSKGYGITPLKEGPRDTFQHLYYFHLRPYGVQWRLNYPWQGGEKWASVAHFDGSNPTSLESTKTSSAYLSGYASGFFVLSASFRLNPHNAHDGAVFHHPTRLE